MAAKSWRCPEPDCRVPIKAPSVRALDKEVKEHEKKHSREETVEGASHIATDVVTEGFLGRLFKMFD